MKKLLLITISFFLILAVTAQEKQIPFFNQSKTYTINKKMANKAGLFNEYSSFEDAKLFLLSDSTYVLEISYKENKQTLRKKVSLTEIEKNKLIQDLQTKLRVNNSTLEINQTGRTRLLIGSTAVGFVGYGPSFTNFVNSSSGNYKVYVAAYMLASGLSFILPYSLTKNKEVTGSQASLTFYGQTRGFYHGTALSYILNDEPNNIKLPAFMGTLFSVGEGIAGFKLAKKWDFNRGDASIFQLGGDVGGIFGLLISDMLGLYGNVNTNTNRMPNIQGIFATSLLSTGAGFVLGKKIADTHQYTLGDAVTLRSTILLGTLFANTTTIYFRNMIESSKPYTLGTIAGAGLGAAIGVKLLKGKDFSTNQGVMIALGEIAGGLIGLGTGFLLLPENSDGASLIMTTATLGATAGFAIMYKNFSQKIGVNSPNNTAMNFSINPAGLMNFTGYKFKNDYYPTLASFHMSF